MFAKSSQTVLLGYVADGLTLCTVTSATINDDVAINRMNSRLLGLTSQLVLPFHNKMAISSFLLIESVADL